MTTRPLRSDRRYVFDASPDVVWATLEHVDGYRSWWPWLDRLDDAGLHPGAHWRCALRSPLGRALRFTITIESVTPPTRITARLAGDLAGPAAVTVAPFDVVGLARCEVRLQSDLVPGDPVLAALTQLVRPVARRAHDHVIDVGAHQFARALAAGRGRGSEIGR